MLLSLARSQRVYAGEPDAAKVFEDSAVVRGNLIGDQLKRMTNEGGVSAAHLAIHVGTIHHGQGNKRVLACEI